MRSLLPILTTLLLVSGVPGCGEAPPAKSSAPSPGTDARAPEDPRWFPLEVGGSWTYQGTRNGQPVGKKVFHCLRKQEDRFLVEEYAGSRMISTGLLRPASDGSWFQLAPGGAGRSGSEGLWLPGDLEPGRSWQLSPSKRARATAREEVEVPALGDPVEAVRVEYEVLSRERGESSPSWRFHRVRWFARGLGVVQEEMVYRPGDWKSSFAAKPPAAHPGDRVLLLLTKRHGSGSESGAR